MNFISEAPRQVPVIHEADVCVVGGSATGVFAAVRAARLGASVVIVEEQNSFGGVATNGLVSLWHSFYDTTCKKQIISGLTEEVMERIPQLDHRVMNGSHRFNGVELKCELDRLLVEEKVKIYLHTMYVGVSLDDNDSIDAIIVENKDGRGAIRAKFFIDATGDGDICRDLGIERYQNNHIQPPSYVFLMQGSDDSLKHYLPSDRSDVVTFLMNEHAEEFDIEPDWGWAVSIPGIKKIRMRANTHVFGLQCAKADDLTQAEIIGREKMRKICRLLRTYGDPDEDYSLVADCSYIGVRDTYHYKTKYQADHIELLLGKDYEDNILNGTYNIDVHHDDHGITFMHFDGTYVTEMTSGEVIEGNWRREKGIDESLPVPTYYRLPFKCLVGERYKNIIAAGRMINADAPSFGALRVMVNLNQIGEAAGVAAYLAIQQGKSVQELDGVEVAKLLSKGGSANLG